MRQEEAFRKGTDEQFAGETIQLGPWTSYSLLNDPKHMSFVLARYKFCAKILESKHNILEIGCGDAFGTPIVAAGSESMLAIDSESRLIESNIERLSSVKNITFAVHNICTVRTPFTNNGNGHPWDGAFSIDVIEHLDRELEASFMSNMCNSVGNSAICIVGTPNITASQYATPRSEVQHINLKSYESLRELMEEYFRNVLMFSMNDEVVHTGYGPMSHYLFGVGIGVK